MGKDRQGTFHPGKGKPSGANKEEGTGLRKTFEPDALEEDQRITDRYTTDADEISPDIHVRHPNRNTSKGEVAGPENEQEKSINTAFVDDHNKTEPEELPGILTKEVFKQLASHDADLCLSILIPTHQAGVAINEQVDVIAFKNALQEAEQILKDKNVPQALTQRMLVPAYDLLRDDAFWQDMQKGLAVYISDGFFKYLRLLDTVSAQVKLSSAFALSALIPFMMKKEYFFLLDIAKKYPRFYRADAVRIEHLKVEEMPSGVDDVVHFEEKDSDKLFRTGGKGGTGSANFHGIGGGKPDEKENIAMYLNEVDKTIWRSHLYQEHVPLLISGQDFLIPIYKSVTDYPYLWPEALTGNHHQQSDQELYEEAMQVMKPYFEKDLHRALEEYLNKSATDRTSDNATEIISGAHYGKISTLFVRKGFQMTGAFDESENKLGEGSEDLADLAVVKTIQFGGDVYLLDDAEMPGSSGMAAIFRY